MSSDNLEFSVLSSISSRTVSKQLSDYIDSSSQNESVSLLLDPDSRLPFASSITFDVLDIDLLITSADELASLFISFFKSLTFSF